MFKYITEKRVTLLTLCERSRVQFPVLARIFISMFLFCYWYVLLYKPGTQCRAGNFGLFTISIWARIFDYSHLPTLF